MALIILSVLLSALAFCKEITAQIAAGIHPIKVICKMRQMMPVNILPLNKKERKGKNMAMRVMAQYSFNKSHIQFLHKC